MCGNPEVRNAGRMPEVRNAGTRKDVGRMPEERRAQSEDGEEKSEERPKNAVQRVICKIANCEVLARLLDIR